MHMGLACNTTSELGWHMSQDRLQPLQSAASLRIIVRIAVRIIV